MEWPWAAASRNVGAVLPLTCGRDFSQGSTLQNVTRCYASSTRCYEHSNITAEEEGL
jgi:hypothetical protein